MNTNKLAGKVDFEAEIAYWEKELSLQGYYPQAIINRATPTLMYKEYPALFEKYRLLVKEPATVLDVGSGPLSMLAYGHYKGFYKLQCVDPLGNIYKELLKKYEFDPSYEIITCPGEKLSMKLPKNFYNIVWMHNALDHSQDPMQVFQQMVEVLAPNGYLCIAGWANEGEAEGYQGLHQNNLYLNSGRLWISSKAGEAKQMDNINNIRVIESNIENNTREWFHIIYQKNM